MKNTKNRFGKALLIYASIFLAAILIASFVFWKYLGSYEASRPDLAMDAFLETADETYWGTVAVKGAEKMAASSFEDPAEIIQRLYDVIRGGKITYRKRSGEYTAETPVYTVRIGGNDFARVSFKPDEFTGFGYYTWTVDEVSLADEFIPSSRTLSITVPKDSSVTINGVSVAQSYISDTVLYSGLSVLESQFTDPISMDIYTIDLIYDNVEVNVVGADGTPNTAFESDGSTYVFELPLTPHTITIQAMEGLNVQLNGALVTDDFITAKEPVAILATVPDYVKDMVIPDMVTYTIPGIYTPEETVIAFAGNNIGSDAAIHSIKNNDGVWCLDWSGTDAVSTMSEDRMDRLSSFMNSYLKFSANLGNELYATWSRMTPYLVPAGQAFDRTYQAMEGLIWNTSISAQIDELQVLSYVDFGDDCFLVRTQMDYTLVRPLGMGTMTQTATFDIVFVKINTNSGMQYCVLVMEPV